MPDESQNRDFWQERTRINLQPTPPPSVLGFFALASASFLVGGYLAGWYKDPAAMRYLFPFAGVFGGLTQLLAAMWCYRARDSVGASLHGSWSAFWLGFGVLNLLFTLKLVPEPRGTSPELGMWMILISAITWLIAVAATREGFVITGVCTVLASATLVGALGEWLAASSLITIAGWLFVLSAPLSLYAGGGLLINEMFRKEMLPLGRPARKRERGTDRHEAIEFGPGLPGSREGQ